MQNYSDVFAQVLNEFESPIVPDDQGDAGKGQVTTRAGYRINQDMNSNIGFISKNPGQTQHAGVAVDALLDKSDATGADFLTDVDLGNGTREIRIAYTPYSIPVNPELPPSNWVQPTMDHVNAPGPLTLKTTPEPPPDDVEIIDELDEIQVTLTQIQDSITSLSLQSRDETKEIIAAVQHFEDRFNQIVEDVESSLTKILLIVLARRDDDDVAPDMPLSRLVLKLLKSL